MYDRRPNVPKLTLLTRSTVTRRVETLVGITGARMAKYRSGWWDVSRIWVQLTWRPHVFGVLLFEVSLYTDHFIIRL